MEFRNIRALVATTLLFTAAAGADSLALQSVNRAGAVIDAAVEAHGGAEALDGLRTVVQEQNYTTIAAGQSRKPGPPYDRGSADNFNAIDLQHERFVNRNRGEGGGYVFDQGVIINGADSWQVNHFSGTAAPLAQPDYAAQSGPFVRVTAPLLIKQLQARRDTSHWLGEVEIDGRPHDVITLVMASGPGLSLYFDRQTHRLARMERVLPPFGQVEYVFGDYRDIEGIPFNQSLELYLNGEENLLVEVLETRVNASLDDFLEPPAELQRVAAVQPDEFASREIDEGVFLVGGNGAYALFVERPDHLVGIGGTQVVGQALAEVRKAAGDKPLRYGVLTHHHNDHVPGAATYAAEGATIVTFSENEQVVLQAAGDPAAQLAFVDGRMTLGEGEQRIELYDIGPTPHAEHLLVAWLPARGILFEADHFPQPPTGVIPPAVPATIAFAAALERLDLPFTRLVGAHSPRVATPEDLRTALERARSVGQAGAGR